MGNDYYKFISEAKRILKKGGQLLIAEVSLVFECLSNHPIPFFRPSPNYRTVTDKNLEQVKSRFVGDGLSLFRSAMAESNFEKTLFDESNSHFILLFYRKATKANCTFVSDQKWPNLKVCTYKKR